MRKYQKEIQKALDINNPSIVLKHRERGKAMNSNDNVYVTANFLNQQIRLLLLLEARAERLGNQDLLNQIREVKNNLIDIKVEQWYSAIDVDDVFIKAALKEQGE